jgi:mannose-1-phosphate guanylyltransferase/mannose-6-phosphate isomerase
MSAFLPLIPVILAGGGGRRLFPISTQKNPKYLLKINSSKSLIEETIERAILCQKEINKSEVYPIFIVSNIKHKNKIKRVIQKLKRTKAKNNNSTRKLKIEYLFEPLMKNTAPAICYSALKIQEKFKDAVLLILPSDHKIQDNNKFKEAIKSAYEVAKENFIVTLGITPQYAETGYGYIKISEKKLKDKDNVFEVEKFTEKPSKEKAEEFMKSGKYFWNAGIFIARTSTILEELGKYTPIPNIMKENSIKKAYQIVPEISIDYAVCEKSKKMACVVADFRWSDVGSFKAIKELFQNDENGNSGNADFIECKNSLVFSQNNKRKKIILFGVENLVIAEGENFLLVTSLEKSQDIKKISEKYDK